MTYAQALAKANAVSQWLLNQHLPAGRPILILSENSINQAILQFAAMQISVPVMPVSPAYSLMSEACGKIADLSQRFLPALIYAGDSQRFAKALAVARAHSPNARWLCDDTANADAVPFDQAVATTPTHAVEEAFEQVGHDTIARLLLTSGSTGSPKAVIMTQRNIIASGVLWDQVWPFLAKEPLVMVDWLPWNHTAGALIWWPPKVLGTLGLPAPGVEAKLVPLGDRYEIRFRGPSITRGYYNDDNEITDKGYINQSGVLKKRADAVKRLYNVQTSCEDCLIINT